MTYEVPEIFYKKIKRGDIVEIPLRNKREIGVVFDIQTTPPIFETKMMGRIIIKKFFTENFLQYIHNLSEYFLCSPSFFLQKTIPLSFLKNPFSIHLEKKSDDKFSLTDFKNIPKFFDLSSFQISSQKNIFIGSNHSSKNAALAELIKKILKKKKQILYIFPNQITVEQAFQKFRTIFADFPENFVEKFSIETTKKQKENIFLNIKTGYTKILLATKNALFFPFKNLGAIFVNQYHSDTYISQTFPFTHAKDIAKIRTKTEKIPLFLEATTGDITEIFSISKKKDGKYIQFVQKKKNKDTISVVDMNAEKMNNNFSYISLALEKALEKNIIKRKQSILYLNRKGVFTSLFCSKCKWSPYSPFSGNKLTVFRQKNGKKILRCNTSKYTEEFPVHCPCCKNTSFIEKGNGTQEIEEYLQKKFPSAKIFRADKDSLSTPIKTKKFLTKMQNGNIDIVIATQLIVESYPFENVSLVANLMIENDILFSSFQTEEKGFMKNMKLFDIIGASVENPNIFIQTFCPQHPFIHKVRQRNFQIFFSTEISERKYLLYPPFSHSIELIKNAKSKKTLEKNYEEIQKKIRHLCIKVFPMRITYHPQKNLYTAKILCFTNKKREICNIIQSKNIYINFYSS